MNDSYEGSAQDLVSRVRAIAKVYPDVVAAMDNPWDLFKLGLTTDGNATLAMAQCALAIVQRELRGTP